jgi:beta-glucanase (GH16 family)
MIAQVAATLALAASLASAQTFTKCDPTQKSCPADPAVGANVQTIDFRKGPNSFFTVADGTTLKYDPNLGAVFTINTVSDAPTISSNGYIFFGKVDVVVQAALGTGVVTSVTLQSDDLDEIDWEWLGGDATQVQTNYFSKGCTDVYDRGGYSNVADPQHNFDTYTIDWNSQRINWLINGNIVRTLTNTGAGGCDAFPQTPMQLKVGTWIAGNPASPAGTIEWGGGLTDFSQAPFYGYYQSITVQDYMGASGATAAGSYSYGDQSGTWQSIKISADGASGSTGNAVSSSSSSAAQTSSTTSAQKTSTTSSSTSTSSSFFTTTTSAAQSSSTTAAGNSTSSAALSTTPTPTPTPSTTPKNAAGKVAGNVLLAGAAVLLGALML